MPADNFARWLSAIRYCPSNARYRRPAKAPLAKGGCLGLPRRGDKRPAGFHIGLYFQKVPTVNPSVTAAPCQLPFAREPFYARYRSMVRYRTFLSSQSTTWAQRTSKSHKPKRGQGVESTTRAKAKGQSPDGSTRGILKGGAIRAGASCSPLEPDNFPYFLAGARKYGPAGKHLQKADWRIDRKAVTG